MLVEEPEPGSQHSQLGVARPNGTDAVHQPVPLVQRHDELPVATENKPFLTRAAGRVREIRLETQAGCAAEAAEPPSSPAGCLAGRLAGCVLSAVCHAYISSSVSDTYDFTSVFTNP